MLKQADAMRVMAERYLKLAKSSDDALKRRKFLDYAAMYAELAEKSVRQEALREWSHLQAERPRQSQEDRILRLGR